MTAIVILLILCLVVQGYYWHFVFGKAARHIPVVSKASDSKSPFLSLVICFHKPFDTLPAVLHSLSRQSYRNFELILVNDGPITMDSDSFTKFLKESSFIRYLEHAKTSIGKKNALFSGINASRGDWIVVTDIDCRPGREWLKTIVDHIPSQPGILLGFSPYLSGPGLLNFVIRQETLMTAFQYLGWAQAGHAYMGVGRNMVSHKSIYEEVTFDNHLHIHTGDDDLFVNEAARKYPVFICNDPASFVYSTPTGTWKAWYRQKARHKSGGKHYENGSKIRLSIYILALVSEKILLAGLLFIHMDLFLIFAITKIILTAGPLRKLYSKFDQPSNFWKMWLYEWFHVIYLILISPYIFFITRKQWD